MVGQRFCQVADLCGEVAWRWVVVGRDLVVGRHEDGDALDCRRRRRVGRQPEAECSVPQTDGPHEARSHRFAGVPNDDRTERQTGDKSQPNSALTDISVSKDRNNKSMISVMLMRDGVGADRYGIRDNNSHVTQPRALKTQ